MANLQMDLAPADNIYDLEWPENMSRYQAELRMYADDKLRNSSPGALPKHEHLRNAINEVIPERYLKWHHWLDRALEGWCYEPMASEWGCSGVGKSSDYGLLALFHVLASPQNTKVVIVTNPMEMHWNRCFKYANFYHSVLPKPLQWLKLKKGSPIALNFDHERLSKESGAQLPSKQTGIECFANKAGDSFEDLKRRIGAHEENMVLIVDEPQGCSNSVLQLMLNMAGGAKTYKERFIGNPSGKLDPLGAHSCPADGNWKKTEFLNEWRTKRVYKGKQGVCYVRDSDDSPAFQDPEKFHFMYGPEDRADAEVNYGKDSAEFHTYSKGRLLLDGGSNIIISEDDLERANCFRKITWSDSWREAAGLDAAAEAGDGTELVRVRYGREEGGRTVIALMNRETIRVSVKKGNASAQIARQVVDWLIKWDLDLTDLAGDKTGNQGPIFDRIEEEWTKKKKEKKKVYRVDASGLCGSDQPIFKGSKVTKGERYFNRATELFFNVVVAAQKSQLVLAYQTSGNDTDTDIVHQLTTRQKEPPHDRHRGKIKIEAKDEWKKRNKKQSPDALDALTQAVTMLVEKGRVILNEGVEEAVKAMDRRLQLGPQKPSYVQRKNRRKNIARRY